MRKRIWRIKVNLRRRWDRIRAPWPIVGECHGHTLGHGMVEPSPECPQCNGGHEHVWAAWPDAPRWVTSGPGVPVRCRRCGARKCDAEDCQRRRHGHTHWDAA